MVWYKKKQAWNSALCFLSNVSKYKKFNTKFRNIEEKESTQVVSQNNVEVSVISHPVEALGLKGVTTGIIKFPPTPGSTPIYRLWEKQKNSAP